MSTFNHCHSGAYISVTFRLDDPVYRALVNASSVTGVSMNSYVNQALASYLCMANPYPTPKPIYRSNYEDTIRKLSGGK
jgi:hypothetical protein